MSIDLRAVGLMQLVASFALTLAGLVVSTVASIVGYRNTYGWKPAVLVTQQVVGGAVPDDCVGVAVTFEVWNRRKYPIRLDFVTVDFMNEEMVYEGVSGGWMAHDRGKKMMLETSEAIQAGGSATLKFSTLFRAITAEEFHDTYEINVRYLDPRKAKTMWCRTKSTVDVRYLLAPTTEAGDVGR